MNNSLKNFVISGLFLNVCWGLVLLFLIVGPLISPGIPILAGWWIGFCSFGVISLNVVFFLNICKHVFKK